MRSKRALEEMEVNVENTKETSFKRRRTRPEYRTHTGPPAQTEKPVCTASPLCEGCPFPGHGFLCQGGDGDCMRTRLMKLSDREEGTQMNVPFPSRAQVEFTRSCYPSGTRIELNHMDDPYAVPPGTRGTVRYVDDGGSVWTAWDNGRSLALIPGVDSFRKLTQQEIAQEKVLTMEGMRL